MRAISNVALLGIIFLISGIQSMNICAQGIIFGVVTNAHNNQVIPNVTVKASGNINYITETDSLGYYELLADLGNYYMEFIKIGYDTTGVDSIEVPSGMIEVNIEMCNYLYPPRNVMVDTMTNTITWEEPLITALFLQNFEDTIFPPNGWQKSSPAIGWFRSDNCTSWQFTVPPGDYYYALSVGGGPGSDPNFADDYLITPMIDLRESENYNLRFDHFFTGQNDHLVFVEYSYNNGNTWEVLEELTPVDDWSPATIDLSEISGINSDSIWFAFHSYDVHSAGSGWAIDNVEITNGPTNILGYNISINNLLVTQTDTNVLSYTFENLTYGNNYFACVAAIYGCGVSQGNCVEWESGFLYPPLSVNDNYIVNNYELELFWNPPCVINTDSVPVGLQQFNLYLNDSIYDSINYTGQNTSETISYYFDSLNPGDYRFNIAAYYDLTEYGFAGEFAESVWTDTHFVEIIWGEILPFFEDWSSGNFQTNNWKLDDTVGNWRINSSIGFPEPILEFYWQPEIDSTYSSSLSSTFIRCDSIDQGSIFFDFDFRLRDRNQTGNEKIKTEVYDGNSWNLIDEYANTGPTIYVKNHFDITEHVSGKIFRVKFTAYGENTRDLFGWYIDNINIYRSCESPENLTATVDWFNFEDPAIKLCWEGPIDTGPIAEWIHWDSGENSTGIGFGSGGTMSVAARWDPDNLVDYEDCEITKIRYYISDSVSSIILKVWTGNQGAGVIYDQDVTALTNINEWNEIQLVHSVPFDINEDLWIGYTFVNSEGTFPAGMDDGPVVSGFGDMVNTGTGWEPLSSYGYNYNFNIQGFIKIIENESDGIHYRGNNSVENSRHMSGYNIYRMGGVSGNEYELYDFVDYVFGQTSFCYYDTVPNVVLQSSYYYKVTAQWNSEMDICESGPAMSLINPEDDFVYIFLEDIHESVIESSVIVYPVPAKDHININSKNHIKSVTITNCYGQNVVSISPVNNEQKKICTSHLKSGIYIITVETTTGIVSKKVVIAQK